MNKIENDESQMLKLNKSYEDENFKNLSKNIGTYTIGKTLGQGTFGKVKLGVHKITNEKVLKFDNQVAIKILEKQKIFEKSTKIRVEREILILKQLHHTNIIRLYEIIETKKTLYMIMEYISGGELFQYINSKRRLVEREAIKFFQQLIAGLEYIHTNKISHRDLKPENLLLDDLKTIKIVDFGLSNIIEVGELLRTPCGSPCYAAPEMICGKRYSGLISDLWSVGIILFVMLCGFLPFDEDNNNLLYKKIINGHFEVPFYVSDKAKDLIKRLLTVDPNKRITIKQIKEHSWFNLSYYPYPEGLFVNKHILPVDEYILSKLNDYNIDKLEAKNDIENNRHNETTCIYYLLLKRHIKRGHSSIADLNSREYIEYLNNSKCLIKNKPIEDNAIKCNEKTNLEAEGIIKKGTEDISSSISCSPIKDKKNLEISGKIDEKIFKKIVIPLGNNISRNKINNIFSNGSSYKKINNTKMMLNSVNKMNTSDKKVIPRRFINTSTNYDSSIDDRNCLNINRTHSESNKKNQKKIKQKFHLKSVIKNYTQQNSNNSKVSFNMIKETEENEKTIKSKENFIPMILIKDKKNLSQRPSLNGKKIRRFFFSNKMSRNDKNHSNLSPDLSKMNTMIDKSALMTRRNSKLKMFENTKTQNDYNNILVHTQQSNRNSSVRGSYSRLNTLTFPSKYLKTKENKFSNQPDVKRITNFSLISKKNSISNSTSTNYSNKIKKKTPIEINKEMKIIPSILTSSYLNEKLKANQKKPISKYPSSEKLIKEISDIVIHNGPFDLSCCNEKSPTEIKENLINVLNSMKIKFLANGYRIKCSFEKNKFVIEINKIAMFPNLYLIRFHKINVNFNYFNEICRKILLNIK